MGESVESETIFLRYFITLTRKPKTSKTDSAAPLARLFVHSLHFLRLTTSKYDISY